MEEIKEKLCFKCNTLLPIEQFYKHKKMVDGHLGKCKKCTKNDVKTRQSELKKDKNWVIAERARGRDKYYRLGYKDLYKPTTESKKAITLRYRRKYPEKYLATTYTQLFLEKKKGFNLHHWSYNQKDWLDIIEVSMIEHHFLHRHIVYDQKTMMYTTKEGVLLDTKEKHLEYFEYCKKTYVL